MFDDRKVHSFRLVYRSRLVSCNYILRGRWRREQILCDDRGYNVASFSIILIGFYTNVLIFKCARCSYCNSVDISRLLNFTIMFSSRRVHCPARWLFMVFIFCSLEFIACAFPIDSNIVLNTPRNWTFTIFVSFVRVLFKSWQISFLNNRHLPGKTTRISEYCDGRPR